MTAFGDCLVAFMFAAFANAIILSLIGSRAHPEAVRFLRQVYWYALLLRYTLAVVLNIFADDSSFAAAFWGDSSTYDWSGRLLALRWSGSLDVVPTMATAVSGYGWAYFVGAVYYIFGQNQLLVQLINGIVSCVTVLVIYSIAANLFDRQAARWAALLMAFFPQMVFWSTGMYKDPAILLCIALGMRAVIRLRERLSLGAILVFVVIELILMTLRFYIAYFVVFAAIATFVFGESRGVGTIRLLATYGILVAVLAGALSFAVRRETLEQQATYLTLARIQVTRQDQASLGGSAFGMEYDVSTPEGALMALPTGLVYLLFAPFPWAISGLRQALALPETLVWYSLMPAFVRGLRSAVRKNFRAVLPILVFATSLIAAYALMQGNVGTAYRQRTQITMFFFVFMGVGLAESRRGATNDPQTAPALEPWPDTAGGSAAYPRA